MSGPDRPIVRVPGTRTDRRSSVAGRGGCLRPRTVSGQSGRSTVRPSACGDDGQTDGYERDGGREAGLGGVAGKVSEIGGAVPRRICPQFLGMVEGIQRGTPLTTERRNQR
jgi:hypothetical protein